MTYEEALRLLKTNEAIPDAPRSAPGSRYYQDEWKALGVVDGYNDAISKYNGDRKELLQYKILLADVLIKLHDIVYWIPENSKDFTRRELKEVIAKLEK